MREKHRRHGGTEQQGRCAQESCGVNRSSSTTRTLASFCPTVRILRLLATFDADPEANQQQPSPQYLCAGRIRGDALNQSFYALALPAKPISSSTRFNRAAGCIGFEITSKVCPVTRASSSSPQTSASFLSEVRIRYRYGNFDRAESRVGQLWTNARGRWLRRADHRHIFET